MSRMTHKEPTLTIAFFFGLAYLLFGGKAHAQDNSVPSPETLRAYVQLLEGNRTSDQSQDLTAQIIQLQMQQNAMRQRQRQLEQQRQRVDTYCYPQAHGVYCTSQTQDGQ